MDVAVVESVTAAVERSSVNVWTVHHYQKKCFDHCRVRELAVLDRSHYKRFNCI